MHMFSNRYSNAVPTGSNGMRLKKKIIRWGQENKRWKYRHEMGFDLNFGRILWELIFGRIRKNILNVQKLIKHFIDFFYSNNLSFDCYLRESYVFFFPIIISSL